MNRIITNEIKADNTSELLKKNWAMLQEWVRANYDIAAIDYKTEILPMSVDTVKAGSDNTYEVNIKLINFDKYLDTYVELRYTKCFSEAAENLLGLKCIFSFSSDGYRSKKDIFREWIRNLSLTFKRPYIEKSDIYDEELRNAMTLFMIRDLTKTDKAFLKKQRNRLMKAFHPDEDGADNEYAAMINNAYEVLIAYCT